MDTLSIVIGLTVLAVLVGVGYLVGWEFGFNRARRIQRDAETEHALRAAARRYE